MAAPNWGRVRYGDDMLCVASVDISPAEHAVLVAHSDVLSLPENLNSNMSAGAVAQAQTKLEALRVPADWVSTSFTYKQFVHRVAAIFLFAQRFRGHAKELLFSAGVTLNTQFNELPQAKRIKLKEAAESMNLDTSSLTATSTIRQILKAMAVQRVKNIAGIDT